MVKLIRLTSEDNCKFNANMDGDIVVGERASIAVQNLTFETIFDAIEVSLADAKVDVNLDTRVFSPDTSGYLKE